MVGEVDDNDTQQHNIYGTRFEDKICRSPPLTVFQCVSMVSYTKSFILTAYLLPQ